MKSHRHRRNGLSITELLVVVAIASALMAMIIPAVQWARERARATACASHLKQIGLAFAQHDTSHNGFPHAGVLDLNTPAQPWNLPPVAPQNVGYGRTQEVVAWGWAYQILPYMDQQVIARKHVYTNPDGTPNAAVQLAAAAEPIADYFCPSRRAPVALAGTGSGRADGLRGALDYAGNGGWRNRLNGTQYDLNPTPYPAAESSIKPDGAVIPAGFVDAFGIFRLERERVGSGSLTDGAASTILVGERNFNIARKTYSLTQLTEDNGYMAGYTWDTIRWAYAVPRGDRNDPAADRDGGFGSSHPSGCNFLFADGAVHFLDYEIDPAVFRQVSSRDDGQSPPFP
jgi:prepilin-type processing-associated H-X9-DG protein